MLKILICACVSVFSTNNRNCYTNCVVGNFFMRKSFRLSLGYDTCTLEFSLVAASLPVFPGLSRCDCQAGSWARPNTSLTVSLSDRPFFHAKDCPKPTDDELMPTEVGSENLSMVEGVTICEMRAPGAKSTETRHLSPGFRRTGGVWGERSIATEATSPLHCSGGGSTSTHFRV